MSRYDDLAREFPLLEEHLLLGAVLGEDEGFGLLGPRSYGHEDGRATPLDGTYLCDLTGMDATLVTGPSSTLFVSAACAADLPPVGECTFTAVLSGDGSLVTVVLLAHTGDDEWLFWDPSARSAVLDQWLGFLARIEQGGVVPFADVAIEDVSASLVPLILTGAKARAVLSDYVAAPGDLPREGQVRDVRLDRIACLVAAVPADGQDMLLVHVPPAQARAIWRSFLSFAEVDPIGIEWAKVHAIAAWPWASWLAEGGRVVVPKAQLEQYGLVRKSGGYVGQRGLA